MSRGSKLTDEERIAAVQEYLEGRGSYEAIAKKYGIALQTLRQKVIYAKTNGIESIRISHTNKQYSAETKLKAVTEYLNGKGSQVEICRRYHISDTKVFRRWISCYNSGKDFKERTRSERGITMNKGRKTTQEERVEIVAFCIEHGKDYGLAMEKYGVSYQQIYSIRGYASMKQRVSRDSQTVGARQSRKTRSQKRTGFVWKTRYCRQRSRIRKWRSSC